MAMERAPEDPRILNDSALILQYHLKRNPELARKIYKKAIKCAKKILKSRDRTAREKADARSALKDARNNLRLLEKDIVNKGKDQEEVKNSGKKR